MPDEKRKSGKLCHCERVETIQRKVRFFTKVSLIRITILWISTTKSTYLNPHLTFSPFDPVRSNFYRSPIFCDLTFYYSILFLDENKSKIRIISNSKQSSKPACYWGCTGKKCGKKCVQLSLKMYCDIIEQTLKHLLHQNNNNNSSSNEVVLLLVVRQRKWLRIPDNEKMIKLMVCC